MSDVPRGSLIVTGADHQNARVLTCEGVLDSSTYLGLRDAIIKAALDEPTAVVIDVNQLSVPSPSAWAVFTSARWHVHTWPSVVIALVCASINTRNTIARNGVARYVPTHASLDDALRAVASGTDRGRQRVKATLPAEDASVGTARDLIANWLQNWNRPDMIPTAHTVVTVFVENVLAHTSSKPVIVAEIAEDTVTVAVQDQSPVLPVRREKPTAGVDAVSGLAIVAALSRTWGSAPTPSGKTVWASLGPENRL